LVRLDLGLNKVSKKRGEAEQVYRNRVVNFGDLYTKTATQLLNNQRFLNSDDKTKRKAFESLNNRVKSQLNEEAEEPRSQNRRFQRLNPNAIMTAVFNSLRRENR